MRHIKHETDFCVVGGGMAGMCAAIAAARHGAKVILMQDRPVLGGNASSEIRMHICGADRSDGKGLRESGILEEIELANIYHNAMRNFSMWDMVLFSMVKREKNIMLLLNCSCNEIEMSGNTIVSVKGWQGTSEIFHTVKAKLFADCSGDSVLAPLSGAQFRIGREARDEFGESIEPEQADKKTMGMSCLIQAKKYDRKMEYRPPEWATKLDYDYEKLLSTRGANIENCTNFWWLELGGENDSIHDTDKLRDELVALAFGVWDYIKNSGKYNADDWAIEWVGFLPGKRESRRYEGDYMLTQNDIRDVRAFDDIVGYGGWSMDDHNPGGFQFAGKPTIFHPAPQPYNIPYRCLYSKNIENLFFAGRNISATHAAMSSTRVMGTCAILGQAVGAAAAIATKNGTTPRGVLQNHLAELQNTLLEDNCYLPSKEKKISPLTAKGRFVCDGTNSEALTNGIERNLGDVNHFHGSRIDLVWEKPERVGQMRIVFDSELERLDKNMPFEWGMEPYHRRMPNRLVRDFDISVKVNGFWVLKQQVRDNHERLVRITLDLVCESVRLDIIKTWGGENTANIFAFEAQD
ncbi:MAG TPA: FAD-dependent oxidoreductase [Oscillospiraceae bacterium]|nr:FAD-dependent oxidoreductase [Oscillospiraceae bacterium]HPF55326.1 FAD-dependent oxidoreductase [Clostridiales bacterium]HPK36090.1 FAD-dependent oxidoreductase [Oscillospiraceae bacterium]HPR76501.1 FAD-dependent oxidoreductase [Oscillospiraceae bacterium]